MKLAWIENEGIRDICPGVPADCYHPDIAALYDTEVPDEATNGDGWVDGKLVPKPIPPEPEPVEPLPPVPPKVSPVEFYLLFTSTERVALKAARPSDHILDDFFDIMEDPRLTVVDLALKSISNALDYMISLGVLTTERKAEILTGEFQ